MIFLLKCFSSSQYIIHLTMTLQKFENIFFGFLKASIKNIRLCMNKLTLNNNKFNVSFIALSGKSY